MMGPQAVEVKLHGDSSSKKLYFGVVSYTLFCSFCPTGLSITVPCDQILLVLQPNIATQFYHGVSVMSYCLTAVGRLILEQGCLNH